MVCGNDFQSWGCNCRVTSHDQLPPVTNCVASCFCRSSICWLPSCFFHFRVRFSVLLSCSRTDTSLCSFHSNLLMAAERAGPTPARPLSPHGGLLRPPRQLLPPPSPGRPQFNRSRTRAFCFGLVCRPPPLSLI